MYVSFLKFILCWLKSLYVKGKLFVTLRVIISTQCSWTNNWNEILFLRIVQLCIKLLCFPEDAGNLVRLFGAYKELILFVRTMHPSLQMTTIYLWIDPGALPQQCSGDEPEAVGEIESVDEAFRRSPRPRVHPFVRSETGQCEQCKACHKEAASGWYPYFETEWVKKCEKCRFLVCWYL